MTKTDEILAGMLTENTGSHFLDSGGAYGRAWEKNQGKEVETFLAEPKVSTSGQMFTISTFHFLTNRLEFDEEMNSKFESFASREENKDNYWTTLGEDFLKNELGLVEKSYDPMQWVNTYNGEDLLSQIIQYLPFENEEDSEWYVLLQIHGGCDARGGYTAPKVFRIIDGYYQNWYSLAENADLELYCENGHCHSIRGGVPEGSYLPTGYDIIGDSMHKWDFWDGWVGTYVRSYMPCPVKNCALPLTPYMAESH